MQLPELEKICEIAKRNARAAIHNDKLMYWTFIKENGRTINISDSYPYLSDDDKQEVLKGFKNWLNE